MRPSVPWEPGDLRGAPPGLLRERHGRVPSGPRPGYPRQDQLARRQARSSAVQKGQLPRRRVPLVLTSRAVSAGVVGNAVARLTGSTLFDVSLRFPLFFVRKQTRGRCAATGGGDRLSYLPMSVYWEKQFYIFINNRRFETRWRVNFTQKCKIIILQRKHFYVVFWR